MAIALVQDAENYDTVAGADGTVTVTFDVTATSGNLLVCFAGVNEDASDETFTGPSGWTAGPTINNTGDCRVASWYKVSDGSETSVTVAASASYALNVHFSEWSGVDTGATPQTNTAQSSANTTLSCGAITPSNNDSLLIAGCVSKNFNSHTVGGGYTMNGTVTGEGSPANNGKLRMSQAYLILGTPASSNYQPTISTARTYAGCQMCWPPDTGGGDLTIVMSNSGGAVAGGPSGTLVLTHGGTVGGATGGGADGTLTVSHGGTAGGAVGGGADAATAYTLSSDPGGAAAGGPAPTVAIGPDTPAPGGATGGGADASLAVTHPGTIGAAAGAGPAPDVALSVATPAPGGGTAAGNDGAITVTLESGSGPAVAGGPAPTVSGGDGSLTLLPSAGGSAGGGADATLSITVSASAAGGASASGQDATVSLTLPPDAGGSTGGGQDGSLAVTHAGSAGGATAGGQDATLSLILLPGMAGAVAVGLDATIELELTPDPGGALAGGWAGTWPWTISDGPSIHVPLPAQHLHQETVELHLHGDLGAYHVSGALERAGLGTA
jgi:hypothetical protein